MAYVCAHTHTKLIIVQKTFIAQISTSILLLSYHVRASSLNILDSGVYPDLDIYFLPVYAYVDIHSYSFMIAYIYSCYLEATFIH